MTSSRITIASIVLCSLAAPACRDEVSLGDPPPYEPPHSPLPVCPPMDELATYAEIGAEFGPIRAMKAGNNGVFVVAARDGVPGTLLQVFQDSVHVLGTVGLGPEAMALDADTVLVACSQSSQVFRVAKNGATTLFVAKQSGVHAVVATESETEAYWVTSDDWTVWHYDSVRGFFTVANVVPPVSLAHDGNWLYVSGGQGAVLKTGRHSEPAMALSGQCDGRMLALTEQDLLCADGNAINRIPRDPSMGATTRAVLAKGTVFDLVVGSGRVFFRFEPQAGSSALPRIMSMPLEGDAAPTVIPRLPGTARFLTAGACALFFAVENTIMRWRL